MLHHFVLAITAVFLTASASIQLTGKWPTFSMSLFIGATTFLTYNVAAWNPFFQWNPFKVGFQKPPALWYFLLLIILVVFPVMKLPDGSVRIALYISIATFLYFLRWGKQGRLNSGLRSIPLVKNILLAGTWALMTVWFPNHNVGITTPLNYLLAGRFIYILAICFGVDLRDIHIDKIQSHTTLPVLLGYRTMKVFALILLLVFAVIIILQPATVLIPFRNNLQRAALLISTVIGMGCLLYLKENDRPEKYTILLDGHMLFQSVLICLL